MKGEEEHTHRHTLKVYVRRIRQDLDSGMQQRKEWSPRGKENRSGGRVIGGRTDFPVIQ